MDMVYKQFMGLKTPVKNEADRLVEESFKEIYEMLAKFVSPEKDPEKDVNIETLIESCKQSNPEYDYFWEWMDENGYSLLAQLDKRLPNTDEIIDFLSYRKMILEMDAMNDSMEMFLLSINEFLVSVAEFLAGYFETAAGLQELTEEGHIKLPNNEVFHATTSHWTSMQSSAPIGAGLLLYI